MTDNQVTVVADTYLNAERWDQMTKIAQNLIASKAVPKDITNAPQALVKMQVGIEMGLKPMEAIMGLTIINGSVTPWGKTTTKLLRNHGWRIQYVTKMDRGGGVEATVTKGDESYTDTLYFDSAVKSGWTHYQNGGLKAGWLEGANREMKLRYGVLSKIIKTYIPEVLGSAQDIAEVAEDYVIEEIPAETTTKPKTEEVMVATPEERTSSLKDFIAKEQNKPKTDVKTPKIAEKVQKDSNSDKKGVEIVPEPQKPQAEEGEIIAATATKEK